MATFRIAQVEEEGVKLLLVPLERKFGTLTDAQRAQFVARLQACAQSARLEGTVIPVWEDSNRAQFIAPQKWHGLVRKYSLLKIYASISGELECTNN
ncbi:hypothetical protein HNR42_000862 [Deinobacterium chartae]|uniref:Uncharacterized protein n=1 Tax=Deinobacterium chartae TaxID=521158 RepID=A0A841I0D7_9DEIO|nr:hypothetical protein [Deinobacterium chartae]MBB6097445.1 hypothetical protein [Deinobacterium chartae]